MGSEEAGESDSPVRQGLCPSEEQDTSVASLPPSDRALLLYKYLEKRRKHSKTFLRRTLSYCRADQTAWWKKLYEGKNIELGSGTVSATTTFGLNVKLSLRPKTEGQWERVTVLCVLGELRKKTDGGDEEDQVIEPHLVGAVNCVAGEEREVSFVVPLDLSGSSASGSKSNGSRGKSSAGTSAGSRERPGCSGDALMYVVWNDHADLGASGLVGGGRGAESRHHSRYFTDLCRGKKLFSVIPDNAEVIWSVRRVPAPVMADATALPDFPNLTSGVDTGLEPLPLARGRLRAEESTTKGLSSGKAGSACGLSLFDSRLPGRPEIPFEITAEISYTDQPTSPRALPRLTRSQLVEGETRSYPEPFTAVRMNYNLGGGEKQRRRKRVEPETHFNFKCLACDFEAGSLSCLHKHLGTCHDLFCWHTNPPTFDAKEKDRRVTYAVGVDPPTSAKFFPRSMTTEDSHKYIPNRNKIFQFFSSKPDRRKYEEGLLNQLRDEHKIREVLSEKGSGPKRKRQAGRPAASLAPSPDQAFHHSRTGQRMTKEEILSNKDSDDEGDTNYLNYLMTKLDGLTMVRSEEIRFMKKWNGMILGDRGLQPVCDKDVFGLAETFQREVLPNLGRGERECFVQHVMVLWDYGALTKAEARKLLDAATATQATVAA